MDYLGAHMSIAGGIHNAPERGAAIACGVIQIFTQNTNRWQGKPVSDGDALLFRRKLKETGLHEVVSHDIYLINLAAPPGEIRDKSVAGFQEEMRRCARLGIGKIIMHPGSSPGETEQTGLDRIIEAFDFLFSSTPEFSGHVLLETTAGQGSNLGHRFEHLREIIGRSAFPERFGVCVDTCHIFAAGYDISTENGYARTFDEFDRIVGIDRIEAFHLNDSKKGVNSRVDRHEHIGQGALGLIPFQLLVNDPRFATVPKLLETPKGDNDEMDVINLTTLRNLME